MNIQQRKNIESLLNKMPKSNIPEIQDEIEKIHAKMKDHIGDHFFNFYLSDLSGIASKFKNNLSRGYIDLFDKDYSNYGPQQYNPYGEDPLIAIERTQTRIERAWKVVQAQITCCRVKLEYYKKQLLPIIESDLTGVYDETIKAIKKIPYDIVYSQGSKEWITATYYSLGSPAIKFSKSQFDKALANILKEFDTFNEKNLLLEIIPIIKKVHNITRKLRRLAEEKWKKDNSITENSKNYKISMHNATGHINSGMGLYTFDILEKFKITHSSLLKTH